MKCLICGRTDAVIRKGELVTAKITFRAHVDCQGHSQYRPVTRDDIDESTLTEPETCSEGFIHEPNEVTIASFNELEESK